MLHVIDNYYAQTNNYGYSVLRDTGKQNLKTGEQTYITLGYVGTIKEALELVKKDIVHGRYRGEQDNNLLRRYVWTCSKDYRGNGNSSSSREIRNTACSRSCSLDGV